MKTQSDSPTTQLHFLSQIHQAFCAERVTDLDCFRDDAVIDCFHPLNEQIGREAFYESLILPLQAAFGGLRRKVDIAMAGDWSPRGEAPQRWLSMTGHFVGQHRDSFLGLPASHRLSALRFGEFYRLEHGVVTAAKLIWDLPGLFAQAGHPMFGPSNGREWLTPGPMSHDGVLRRDPTPEQTAHSLQLVEAMIAGLMSYDGKTLESMGMERFWSKDMLWHGPWGIGSSSGLKGFQDVHQRPFLAAFPDRKGGHHSARFADGPYVCSTGWPSIRATQLGDYLGHPATGRSITMRVMDWWRVEHDRLSENWVFIDLPHLFLQFGRDLLHEALEAGRSR